MMLIKLGGSVVTDKSRSMTARPEVIARLAAEIAGSPGKKIIIHGGGSFGHIKAKHFELHKGFKGGEQTDGICQVQEDMRVLNRLIVDSLRAAGLPVASIPAGAIATFDDGKLADFPSEVFRHYTDIGIVPISFGDVVVDRARGISICSGDDIMLRLARDLKADRCIFVTGVDGIYPRFPAGPDDSVLPLIRPGDKIQFTVKDVDVTGSMQRKLDLMFDIARGGTAVEVINGFAPGRLADTLAGIKTTRTVIRGD